MGVGRVGLLLMMFGNFNSGRHTHRYMTAAIHTYKHTHTHAEDTFSIQLAAKRVSGSHSHMQTLVCPIHLASLSHRTRTLSNKHSNRSFFHRANATLICFVCLCWLLPHTHTRLCGATNKQTSQKQQTSSVQKMKNGNTLTFERRFTHKTPGHLSRFQLPAIF